MKKLVDEKEQKVESCYFQKVHADLAVLSYYSSEGGAATKSLFDMNWLKIFMLLLLGFVSLKNLDFLKCSSLKSF